MARTPSNMLPLGTKAPDFKLPATNFNDSYTYNDVKGTKGTLVMFICNHCPYVVHVIDEVVMIANDYRVQGIGVVAISSNDVVNYPQDAPDKMADFALGNRIDFPYLYDETQEIAKAYDAACTPDFYLFDNRDQLVYRGQLDDSRPGNSIPVSGSDLRAAIDAILYNRKIDEDQKPSMGCNIKWK
ncbi:thioredoxin family protein [Flavobacterium sp. NRK F10]|uniref:thioredoxin family protein n=1 Tax=Flavobacterium sp. NRK F10 TaxID=2954931 RepID=UPI0020910E17|nr:thioredoxin family protein [Flavobacterium sp. NRK F10]MCO6175965.1 thioredoxin family protein [Flavobacterium sp. NRK F10]